MSKDNKGKKEKKSSFWGWMTGIAVFFTLMDIFPFSEFLSFFIALALASGAKRLVTEMANGLDLTTHNKKDEEKRARSTPPPPSGDTLADETIAKGIAMLKEVQQENDAIPDEVLSHQMDELNRICMQIFSTIAEKPGKAPQIRKFINYYLPTSVKMIRSYRIMEQRGVSARDLANARNSLTKGISMVLTASQKQLDSLYRDDMLDVTTDIDVMEQMLKRDGFSQDGLGQTMEEVPVIRAATAASAQMATTGAPVLNTSPPSSPEDDFISFYSQSTAK